MILPSPGTAAAANNASINISASTSQARRMRPITDSDKQAPAQSLTGVERNQPGNLVRHLVLAALEGQRSIVERQAVEARSVDRREGFEAVERALRLEHAGIAFQRVRRREQSRAAARRFLRPA